MGSIILSLKQGSQFHTEGCTDLTSGMKYFGIDQYWCIVSGLPLLYILINIKVYHKILPQFRTNLS